MLHWLKMFVTLPVPIWMSFGFHAVWYWLGRCDERLYLLDGAFDLSNPGSGQRGSQ